jgi:hypothetical protein
MNRPEISAALDRPIRFVAMAPNHERSPAVPIGCVALPRALGQKSVQRQARSGFGRQPDPAGWLFWDDVRR